MSVLADMGISGVGVGIYEPKRKNRWAIYFTNLGDGTASDDLSLQAISVNRPSIDFEENQIDRYNGRGYSPGKYTWEVLNLVVEDDINSSATSLIRAQFDKQQALIGAASSLLFPTAQSGSDMKFTATMTMFDGNNVELDSWIHQGCWISGLEYNELDYANGEHVKINITIRYDHASQIFNSTTIGNAI